MKSKVSGNKLREWMKEIKTLFRNPKFVGMLTVAIITVSLPVTIIALNNNTDNRQHANTYQCTTPSDCPPAPPYSAYCIEGICRFTTCGHNTGYCIHTSPEICGSNFIPTTDSHCGTGSFDRCCVPSSNPCAGVHCGNGNYCGGACGNTGSSNTLYDCENGQVKNSQSCSNGCQVSSSGPDECKGSGGGGGSGKTIKNQYNECVIAGLHIDGECRSTWKTPDGRTISNGSYTGWEAHIIQYSDGTYNNCSSMNFTFTGCEGVGREPTDTPTPKISPTDTPAPSPTDSPIQPDPSKTTGNISLQLEGISSTENPTPLHPNRQVILYFYPPTDTSFQRTPYVSPIGIVTYNSATGFFSNANFPLKGLSAGQYLVLVRSLDGSLVSQIGTGDGTGPITITTTGDTNMLVDTQDTSDTNADTTVPILKMGDIVPSGNSFNIVDTLDYSTFVDCYGNDPSHLSDTCFKHQGIIDVKTQVFLPDLNDDGKVDGIDYTLLERNYGHYGVGANTMNRGNDPTKN